MIPVEIVVTFVIGYLVFRGIVSYVQLKGAHAKIATLEREKAELAEAVLRLEARAQGPGTAPRGDAR